MPKKRLTAAMVERTPPPAKGQLEYWDRNMPGFGLRVSYRGTKSWVLMVRVAGKVPNDLTRVTLGEWPLMSLAEAHEAAREAKKLAKAGIDPKEHRRQQQLEFKELQLQTFGAMAEQFLVRYAKPRLRTCTMEGYESTLRGRFTETWRDRPIASITRRDVMALIDGLESRGKHGFARVTLAHLKKFFAWCAERDVISDLPTHRVRLSGALKPRERTLSPGELRRAWAAADRAGGIGAAIIKLLVLTGQRRTETAVMRWRDVAGLDSGNAVWSLPSETTKNHRPHDVPLAPEAVAVIQSMPVITVKGDNGEYASDLVFTLNGRAPWTAFSPLKHRLDDLLANDGGEPMAPWTFHDLRRSLVTGLNENGIAQPHVIESIVNHITGHRGGIAGVYNKATYADERRRALEAWACKRISPAAMRISADGVEKLRNAAKCPFRFLRIG